MILNTCICQHSLCIVCVSYIIAVMCPAPDNGWVQCQGHNQSYGYYQDVCTFHCKSPFKQQGPDNGICIANNIWSEGNARCVAGLFLILFEACACIHRTCVQIYIY